MRTRLPSARTASLAVFQATAEAFGDTGHRQVLTHDPFQRPPQAPTREPCSWLGGLGGVLTPHVSAAGAPVTADRDQQRRETPAQQLVRQATRDGIARRSLTAAPAAPLIPLHDPAGQDRAVALETLPDNPKAKPIQPDECGQVRSNEGNVRHVEVFPIGSVRTPLIGRPRPLPSNRHAHPATPSIVKSRKASSAGRSPLASRFADSGRFRLTILVRCRLSVQRGATARSISSTVARGSSTSITSLW